MNNAICFEFVLKKSKKQNTEESGNDQKADGKDTKNSNQSETTLKAGDNSLGPNRSTAPLHLSTTRVTGFIVAVRWCLFGYALSLGIFAAAETFPQLIIAAAISGAFFPVLLVTSSNVIVYNMKRLPSVMTDIHAIYCVFYFYFVYISALFCFDYIFQTTFVVCLAKKQPMRICVFFVFGEIGSNYLKQMHVFEF